MDQRQGLDGDTQRGVVKPKINKVSPSSLQLHTHTKGSLMVVISTVGVGFSDIYMSGDPYQAERRSVYSSNL